MNLGLTPRKANTVNKDIIPKNYQWDFIRGLWDADGCIHLKYMNNNKRLHINISLTGNYPLLNGIKEIINESGTLIENKSRSGRGDSLAYSGRIKPERILDKIYYNKPYLDRKFKLYKDITDYSEKYNNKGHKIRKYDININRVSYVIKNCLLCDKEFLARTSHVEKGGTHGCFCCKTHSALYHSKLRKESIKNKNIIYINNNGYRKVNCLYCGKEILIHSWCLNKDSNKGKFCCRSHASLYRWVGRSVNNYAIANV